MENIGIITHGLEIASKSAIFRFQFQWRDVNKFRVFLVFPQFLHCFGVYNRFVFLSLFISQELALLHHKTRSATVLCKDEVSLLAVCREVGSTS